MQRVIERMLNLLAFLLTVGRPVSADEIRHTVAGYDQETDEAFRRTFERDKDLLKRLGVPLRLDFTDAWEVEQGYVVSPEDYALEDPGLTDEERAALWLASRMARLGSSAAGTTAIFKLGGAPMHASGDPLVADLEADPEILATAFEAVLERRRLAFEYRDRARRVEPYGLVHRMGHWYLVAGADGDVKVFRIDRMSAVAPAGSPEAFDRPQGLRAADAVPSEPWEMGGEQTRATVVFDPEIAWWARRQVGRRAELHEAPDGALHADMPVGSPEAFIGWIIGFEDKAEITAPPELRERFLDHIGAT